MTDQKEFEAPTVNGSPEEIYLIYGDIECDVNHNDCADVGWCEDQQYIADVRYVRADIYEKQAKELEALRKKILSCESAIYQTELGLPYLGAVVSWPDLAL